MTISFMKKFIVSISFCVAVFVFSATEAFACKCMAKKQVKNEYQSRSAIFSGKVSSIVKDGAFHSKVRIRIGNLWKGDAIKFITFSTANTGMCDYSFVKGESYLIYANGKDSNSLSVSICSRTKNLSDAKEDIEVLNKLKQGTKSSPK